VRFAGVSIKVATELKTTRKYFLSENLVEVNSSLRSLRWQSYREAAHVINDLHFTDTQGLMDPKTAIKSRQIKT
jgi:hypothetical protein